jgi:hypothetical protein
MSESAELAKFLTQLLSDPSGFAARIKDGGSWNASIAELAAIAAAGFAIHGLVLGSGRPGWQTLSATMKAPLVPLLSLLITTPLLHTVALGVGGDWSLGQTVALALVPLAVTAILLAAASPLLLFFGATSDYHFTKLLHVGATALFSLCGVVALLRVLGAMSGPNTAIFVAWVLAFFFVSAQMAWILRPFIGSPDKPFRWLGGRDERLNFYTAVALSLAGILSRRPTGSPEGKA